MLNPNSGPYILNPNFWTLYAKPYAKPKILDSMLKANFWTLYAKTLTSGLYVLNRNFWTLYTKPEIRTMYIC